MKRDADSNAADDQKKRDIAEAKNLAEQLVYSSEKALKDAGDKVPPDLKTAIETKIADLKKAKDNTTPDLATIKAATESLSTELQKIGQHMNQNSSTTPGQPGANPAGEQKPGGDQGPAGTDGNVRDAEVK